MPAMSVLSLANRLVLVATDPALVGHPVVAGLVTMVEVQATKNAWLRERIALQGKELAELRRQLDQYSGNCVQLGHAGMIRRQVAAAQVNVPIAHWSDWYDGCGVAASALGSDRASDLGGAVRATPRCADSLPVLRAAPAGGAAVGVTWRGSVALSIGTVEIHCRRTQTLTLRVAGRTLGLQVLCDVQSTCYHLSTHGEVWKAYTDTAVHDRFTAYLSPRPDEINHGICNAHRLRNLEEIVKLEKAPDGWATRLQRLLRETRDVANHWYETTGGPVPKPIRAATAAAWDAFLTPVLNHHENWFPPVRGCHRGHNPTIRDFYTHLCRRSKPKKVTFVAAMHKLLLNLNAVIRDQVPWQLDAVPIAFNA